MNFTGFEISLMARMHWPSAAGAVTPYHVGDQIQWHQRADGSTPGWAYFSGQGGNLGAPTVEHLIATNSGIEWLIAGRHCLHCNAEFGVVAVEIKQGIIQRACFFGTEEIYAEASTHLVTAEGMIQPAPEWDDHGMGFMED